MDIFERIKENRGPLGRHSKESYGYFMFPKLEGEIGAHMKFRGKNVLVWSLNNYLGLANHPEVRKADEDASKEFGLAYPMGARMMSGNTNYHEQLEHELAAFESKEDAILLNYGYQGMVSAIDCLMSRNDVIVYDSESHACILDGMRLHFGKRFVFQHNDLDNFEKQLVRAVKLAETNKGGVMVLTEGVFGMAGDQGKLREIIALKKKYPFRLFVDDAHGFGTMGKTGAGTGEEQNCQDGIDIYFGTFAKAMALIGGFIASTENVIDFLRHNMRSQIFAKSLPMPMVLGALKRLELLRTRPELKNKLWEITHALQDGLHKAGFNIGYTNSPVTPVFLSGSLGEATNLTFDLRENYGIFCSIVVYPVVPKGTIMLRLIPTAAHSIEDVTYSIDTFKKLKAKLEKGEYQSDHIVKVN